MSLNLLGNLLLSGTVLGNGKKEDNHLYHRRAKSEGIFNQDLTKITRVSNSANKDKKFAKKTENFSGRKLEFEFIKNERQNQQEKKENFIGALTRSTTRSSFNMDHNETRTDNLEISVVSSKKSYHSFYSSFSKRDFSLYNDSQWQFSIKMNHNKKLYLFAQPLNWIRITGEIILYEAKNKVLARKFIICTYPVRTPLNLLPNPNGRRFQPLELPGPSSGIFINNYNYNNNNNNNNNNNDNDNKNINYNCNNDANYNNNNNNSNNNSNNNNFNNINDNDSNENYNNINNNDNANYNNNNNNNNNNNETVNSTYNKNNNESRVWLQMDNLSVFRGLGDGLTFFNLVLFFVPNPIVSTYNKLTRNNGWKMISAVIPSAKYGVQNVSHSVQYVPHPSNCRKHYQNSYLTWTSYHFQILWENQSKKKSCIVWNSVIEFAPEPSTRNGFWQAKILISSAPFNWTEQLKNHSFIPKPSLFLVNDNDPFFSSMDIQMPLVPHCDETGKIRIKNTSFLIRLPQTHNINPF